MPLFLNAVPTTTGNTFNAMVDLRSEARNSSAVISSPSRNLCRISSSFSAMLSTNWAWNASAFFFSSAGISSVTYSAPIVWVDDTMGAEDVTEEIPAELKKKAEAFHAQLVESIAENDDEILHKFLEGEEITADELRASLRKSTIALKVFPVVVGTAFKNKGVQPLLDAVVDYLPSPLDVPETHGLNPDNGEQIFRKAEDKEPFSALAFKIMADPFVGQLTFIRVYSGQLKTGDSVLNTGRRRSERIGRLLKMHANKREEISEILAGDICAAVGLKGVSTGDT